MSDPRNRGGARQSWSPEGAKHRTGYVQHLRVDGIAYLVPAGVSPVLEAGVCLLARYVPMCPRRPGPRGAATGSPRAAAARRCADLSHSALGGVAARTLTGVASPAHASAADPGGVIARRGDWMRGRRSGGESLHTSNSNAGKRKWTSPNVHTRVSVGQQLHIDCGETWLNW